MLLGVGYDGADKLMSFLSLPHFKTQTYIEYAKHITQQALHHTQSVLEKCRAAVCKNYASKEEISADGTVNVGVSFDG